MFSSLTFMVDLIMNLMNGLHDKCERRVHNSSCFESTKKLLLKRKIKKYFQ